MDDDVGAEFDRPKKNRRRDRVVDDQRHVLRMGDRSKRLDIADIARRIANALAVHGARVVVDQSGDLLRAVVCREAHRDAHLGQKVGEERVRRAVELWH